MTPSVPESRPPTLSEQVDLVCDQFEASAQVGKWLRIEDVVAAFPASGRSKLLIELVAIEIDLRLRRGEVFDLAVYRQRFPEAVPILDELVAEAQRGTRERSKIDPFTGPVDANAETIALPNAPRRQIKQFELLSILGHGGFGTVWRARDTLLQRDVAVKVPRKDRVSEMNMSLFLREARAAAKLRHPNIVAIHEVGEENSSAFIVSDFVDGVNLKSWLESVRHPSTTESAMLVAKLAAAAHHAHECGIVHRDLKPANVLMDHRGEPHILDFGLAKRDTAEDSLAISDQLVGTPAYMAPEQARGDHRAIDRRTDVYALGAILYELLTGQRAFAGELALMLNQIQHVPPLAPRKIKPEIPTELEAICLKCLAKDSAQRYPTAQVLADDLHRHLAGETLVGIPSGMPVRVQKWFHRHRKLLLASLAIALLAGLFGWWLRPLEDLGEFRRCRFTTAPTGCEITVVAIDDNTGEPDPERIQSATGVTPLTMPLAPGKYLVVAALPGESRFHEVSREVPTVWDIQERMRYPHSESSDWSLLNGEIELRQIVIPGPDVTGGMGFVAEQPAVEEPPVRAGDARRIWKVPPFFVDAQEFHSPENPQKFAKPAFGIELNRLLEAAGKRPPTAAEMYVLTARLYLKGKTLVQEAPADEPECVLPDRNRTRVEALHSGLWEWTMTRPGGPFSGIAYSPTMGDFQNLRMVGGGDRSSIDSSALSATGLKWEPELSNSQKTGRTSYVGVRAVRSAKPRRKPEDFLQPAPSQTPEESRSSR